MIYYIQSSKNENKMFLFLINKNNDNYNNTKKFRLYINIRVLKLQIN